MIDGIYGRDFKSCLNRIKWVVLASDPQTQVEKRMKFVFQEHGYKWQTELTTILLAFIVIGREKLLGTIIKRR